MALRVNHYDAAFEEFLRSRRVPYVAVDEHRRSLLQDVSLKSMDFIVYSRHEWNLLVDVKGRRFPSGDETNRHKWESWATADDVASLVRWQDVFGAGFRAVLIFAYHVVDERFAGEFEGLFDYRDRTYAFFGVWADEYRAAMRVRSASWDTVWLPSRAYRRLRSPIQDFL